jgi:hypothetical protein
MAASIPRRKNDAVIPHLFDAGQHASVALVQVVTDEIDGLHAGRF